MISTQVGGTDCKAFGFGGAEQSAYDAAEKLVYAVSEQKSIAVVDATTMEWKVSWSAGAVGALTSAKVCGGKLYVAAAADVKTDDGSVLVYDTVRARTARKVGPRARPPRRRRSRSPRSSCCPPDGVERGSASTTTRPTLPIIYKLIQGHTVNPNLRRKVRGSGGVPHVASGKPVVDLWNQSY